MSATEAIIGDRARCACSAASRPLSRRVASSCRGRRIAGQRRHGDQRTYPRHRRRRLHRLLPLRAAAATVTKCCASTTSSRHDVMLPLFVEVDEIYNLACPASPIHYQHDPVQTTKTSVHGAITIYGEGVRGRENIPHWRRHAPEGTECRRLET